MNADADLRFGSALQRTGTYGDKYHGLTICWLKSFLKNNGTGTQNMARKESSDFLHWILSGVSRVFFLKFYFSSEFLAFYLLVPDPHNWATGTGNLINTFF